MDGHRLVVGVPTDGEHSGAAYVFRRDGSVWLEEAKLAVPEGTAACRFSGSVSISGDRIAVGARYYCEWLGDVDGDGDVDASDLGILLADWGSTSNCVGDLDGDDDTDQSDLGILLADWDCMP